MYLQKSSKVYEVSGLISDVSSITRLRCGREQNEPCEVGPVSMYRSPRFSDEQSKFYGLIIAAIFAHMHASNIVHRTLSLFCKASFRELKKRNFSEMRDWKARSSKRWSADRFR